MHFEKGTHLVYIVLCPIHNRNIVYTFDAKKIENLDSSVINGEYFLVRNNFKSNKNCS